MVQSMGSLGLAIHFGWVVTRCLHQSKCWLLDYPGSTTGKKGAGERFRLHQTELRAEEVQSEYAREGWNSLWYVFYSPPTSGNREKMRTQKAASVEAMKWVGSMMRE